MKKLLCITALIIMTVDYSYSQRARYDISDLGIFPADNCTAKATVNCDSKLQTTVANICEANKRKELNGWRVQIFFASGTTARAQAEAAKTKFFKCFPDESAYLVYEPPYFKVRVGNCRNKLEAAGLKKKASAEFKGVFIVESKIEK